uniref:MARVEL domain-containing protein n=1 Tax=Steinernema glaseri TaxID=37863 RepID=A0A1I7ZQM8_9BILA
MGARSTCTEWMSPVKGTIFIGALTIFASLFALFDVTDSLSPLAVRTTVKIHNVTVALFAFFLIVGAKNRISFLFIPFIAYLAVCTTAVLLVLTATVVGQFNIALVIRLSDARTDSSQDLAANTRIQLLSASIGCFIFLALLTLFFEVILKCYLDIEHERHTDKKPVMDC